MLGCPISTDTCTQVDPMECFVVDPTAHHSWFEPAAPSCCAVAAYTAAPYGCLAWLGTAEQYTSCLCGHGTLATIRFT